jgi:UDP-N-acetylglucosamine 4,6-dehydratase/5-epimerase
VRRRESLLDAMTGVDYVFHAAALKQVPSCEFYPMEALQTNAIGAENVMNAAIAAGVQNVVVLSTDKAAYPINAMGISKAMMEKLAVAKSRVAAARGCTIAITRYGNVMASRGSVIPLFIDQIKAGQPLTVTDPQMTRFHDEHRRRGRPGALRLPARPAGRPLCAKSAGGDNRHAGPRPQADLPGR